MKKIKKVIEDNKGIIVFDDLSKIIDSNNFTENNIDLLKDDLLQIQFNQNQLIDIGWYPSFDLTGLFQIRLVKDLNWEDLVFFAQTSNKRYMLSLLEEAISKLEK